MAQSTARPFFSSNFHQSDLPSWRAKQHPKIWTHFNILSHKQFVFLQQWEFLFPTVLLLQLETCIINLLAKYLYISNMLLASRHIDHPCSAFLVLRQILLTTYLPLEKLKIELPSWIHQSRTGGLSQVGLPFISSPLPSKSEWTEQLRPYLFPPEPYSWQELITTLHWEISQGTKFILDFRVSQAVQL